MIRPGWSRPAWPIAFLSGLLLGSGLVAGGISQPAKVLAFLDLAGAWDPTLVLVMAGAIGMALPAFAWARRRPHAWTGDPIRLPASRAVDRRLILGSVLFGIGWGWSGLCPGPAVLSLGFGVVPGAVFVIAILIGQRLAR